MAWHPTEILRFEKSLATNSCAARVQTDLGPAYLKAMGPHESPNALACELIGTRLAQWLGLNTLNFSVIALDDIVEIELKNALGERIGFARPGPAFITRAEDGSSWGGNARQLTQLSNPDDISRLVVFDTWTLNCDRYRPPQEGGPSAKPRVNLDNVFLSAEAPPGKLLLKAIDHGCCFTCGRELTSRVGTIDNSKSPMIYGRFPDFQDFLDRSVVREATARLRTIDKEAVASMMADLPTEWEVRKEVLIPWIDLIVSRAIFVADTIEAKLWPQQEFDFPEKERDHD